MAAGIIDKDNAANCKLFIDGSEDGTTNKAGNLALVGDITNAAILHVGSNTGESLFFDGIIGELGICYPADVTAADEFGASGEQANVYAGFRDRTNWPNREDSWLLNEGTGTTLTGESDNLTLSNAAAWSRARRP
jgi:hypothetical protein